MVTLTNANGSEPTSADIAIERVFKRAGTDRDEAGSAGNVVNSFLSDKIASSAAILRDAIETFNPTHIVSMVSGGKDSAASDQVAREIGANIDMVVHGNTRCGIPETSARTRQKKGSLFGRLL